MKKKSKKSNNSFISDQLSQVLGGDIGANNTYVNQVMENFMLQKKKLQENETVSNQITFQLPPDNSSNNTSLTVIDKGYTEDEIRTLFQKNVWTTEKVKIWDELKLYGRLNDFGLSDSIFSPYYRGKFDLKLKKPNLSWELSELEQEEIKKCVKDITYFAENYCKVKNEESKYKLIKLRDYQRDALEKFAKNRFIINNWSRQMGKSVLTAIFFCWFICFRQNKNCLITSMNGNSAEEDFKKIMDMYRSLPMFLKPGYVGGGEVTRFDNNINIYVQATTSQTGRGLSIDLLYVDEFAHIKHTTCQEFWTSILPVISSINNSKIIITSTPNGRNLFYDLWTSAIAGENDFVPIKVEWWQDPRKDEEWRKKEIGKFGGDVAKFNQEYGLQFDIDAQMIIDSSCSKLLSESCKNDYVSYPNILNGIFYTKEGVNTEELLEEFRNDFYILSFDFSSGTGGDYNVCSIFKINKKESEETHTKVIDYVYFEQVAYISSNDIGLERFSMIVSEFIYTYFNTSKIKLLLEANDNRMYVLINTLKQHKNFDSIMFYKSKYTEKSRSLDYGVRVNSLNKILMCDKLKENIINNNIILSDKKTVDELRGFSYKNDKVESIGKHDDVAMTVINLNMMYLQDRQLTDFFYNVIGDDKEVIEKLKKANVLNIVSYASLVDEFERDFGLKKSKLNANYELFKELKKTSTPF